MIFDFSQLKFWASEKRKELIYGSLILGISVFAGLSVYFKFRGNQDTAYFQACRSFYNWKEASENKKQIFDVLKKQVAKFSGIQSRFDALIAQHLIYSKNLTDDFSYANAALKRLKIADTDYQNFSKAALIIARGEVNEALDESKKLRSNLEKQFSTIKSGNPFAPRKHTLYALNLIRIAYLEKQLGHEGGELEALAALERSIEQFPELRVFLQQNLKEGALSFYDYLKIRKTQLATS